MSNFGYKKRAEQRAKNKIYVQKKAGQIVKKLWECVEFNYSSSEHFSEQFNNDVLAVLSREFPKQQSYRDACEVFLDFINNKNKSLNVTEKHPLPVIPTSTNRSKLVKNLLSITQGKQLEDILNEAIHHWQCTNEYSVEETLGWLLFSAALNGLNDVSALAALIKSACSKSAFYRSGSDTNNLMIFLDVPDKGYGNVVSDSDNEDTIHRSLLYIPPPLVLLWLNKVHELPKSSKNLNFDNLDLLLQSALKSIAPKYKVNELTQASSYILEFKQDTDTCPALSELMRGNIKSCSLSAQEFARFNHNWQPIEGYAINIYKDLEKDGLESNKNNESELSDDDEVKAEEHSKLTNIAYKKLTKILKASNKTIVSDLSELLKAEKQQGFKILIEWSISLISPKQGKKIATSSLLRYLGVFASSWIKLTWNQDVTSFEAEDYEKLYLEILNNKVKEKNIAYNSSIIQRFHSFLIKRHSAPVINIGRYKNREFCRAYVLGPSLFKAILTTLESSLLLCKTDINTFLLIYIILYRSGLRREEVIGLQLRDIEATLSLENKVVNLSFIVRNNHVRSLKTGNSQRHIPIGNLLKPEELQTLIKHWYKQKRAKKGKTNTPLFTLSNTNNPIAGNYVNSTLSKAAYLVMGSHNYTLHSLRHTALSNLALVLRGTDDLIEQYTDYSPEDVIRIREGLLGTTANSSDHWYALAQLAGHLSPEQTFRSYIHFGHLQAGQRLSNINIDLPNAAIEKLTGFSSSKVYRYRSKDSEEVSRSLTGIKSLKPALIKNLKPHIQDWKAVLDYKVSSSRDSFEALDQAHNSFDLMAPEKVLFLTLPDSRRHEHSMEEVYFILSEIEKGQDIESLIDEYNINPTLLDRWLVKAKALAALTTRKGNSKLIYREDETPPLIPSPPNSDFEKTQARWFFLNAGTLFINQPEELRKFLNIFIDKVQPTRAGIYFRHSQKDDLKFFIESLEKLTYITSICISASSNTKAAKIKKELNIHKKIGISKTYLNKKYTGFEVFLTRSASAEGNDNPDNKKPKRYTSSVLKYACHMLLITLPPEGTDTALKV